MVNNRAIDQIYAVGVALLAAMLAGSVLILAFGESPLRVYSALIASTWGDASGFGEMLFKTTPLIFTGLAVALAFRVGLFNIGCEGQLMAGSLACAVVGAGLPASLPGLLAVTLCLVAAMLAGGLLGAVPGALRAYRGAHEVISTIMLNFITASVVLWLGNRSLFVTETTHTDLVVEGARLAGLGLGKSKANLAFAIALLCAAGYWLFMERSRVGFELRALGKNPGAAANAGVPVKARMVLAMTASGAMAGLVGANYVLGGKYYFEEGMGRGMGFMGIAVALLGRGSALGIVLAALLFGTLSHGALSVNSYVPKELIDVLQAVIIIAVAVTTVDSRRRRSK
jgi:simple sugar transport system permease protein